MLFLFAPWIPGTLIRWLVGLCVVRSQMQEQNLDSPALAQPKTMLSKSLKQRSVFDLVERLCQVNADDS